MLPEGWCYKKFGELAEFKNGLNFPADARGDGLKLVGVGDFKDNLRITTDALEEVSGFENIDSSYLIQDHDLLFVRSNGNKALIGRVLYFEDVDDRVSHSGFTIRARIAGDPTLSLYVAQFFRADMAREQFHRLGGGTNISNLSQDMLAQLDIPLPPKEQQKGLLALLDKWDHAEDRLQAQCAAKRVLKKGLMQQLLTGQRRFPEFGPGVAYGDQPNGWELPHAGEVFARRSVKNHGDATVLSVTQDQGVVPRDQLDRKIMADADNYDNYKLVEIGDFVISLRSFQGGLEYSAVRGLVSPAYHVIRPARPIVDDFFRHYFKSYEFIGRLARSIIGIRDGKQVNFDDFSFLRVPYPPLPEQQRIADTLNTADREIALLEQELKAVKTQKKGLMQQLLTGKKRVPVESGKAS